MYKRQTQERNLRAGTENVVGIAGLGKAFEISVENMTKFSVPVSYTHLDVYKRQVYHHGYRAISTGRCSTHALAFWPNAQYLFADWDDHAHRAGNQKWNSHC